MRELVKGPGLFKAEHLEGITSQSLALERARNKRSREPRADAERLGVEEIPPACLSTRLENLADPRQLILVKSRVVLAIDLAGVHGSAQNDKCADLEPPGQPFELFG